MYNIGDFMGKVAGDFRRSFNSYSIKYLLGTRLLFFYTMICFVKAFAAEDVLFHNDFFPFFNMFLFAFTNGFVISSNLLN